MDVGLAKVGIARGSDQAKIAQPLKTVPEPKAITELKSLAEKDHAVGIVVGLPRGLESQETKQTETVRRWTKTAMERINLPFYWQDEALTSKIALSREVAKLTGEDAIAASVILQDFLDSPEDRRVRC